MWKNNTSTWFSMIECNRYIKLTFHILPFKSHSVSLARQAISLSYLKLPVYNPGGKIPCSSRRGLSWFTGEGEAEHRD